MSGEHAPLRWGVLGTGMIVGALIPPLRSLPGSAVLAIASEDGERAANAAARFSIATAHASYQALLDDPTIDCVYNALPNDLHHRWTMRALQAGKHVLCEKPLAGTPVEGEEMAAVAVASERLLMEAMMARFHPRTQTILDLVASGGVGAVRHIDAAFSFTLRQPENYRNRPERHGGALYDVGVYCLSAMRWLLGRAPVAVHAVVLRGPSGIDESTCGLLAFEGGVTASFMCGFRAAEYQRLTIVGDEFTLDVPVPFTAWREQPAPYRLLRGAKEEVVVGDPADPYAAMAAAFMRAVREGAPVPYPLSESLAVGRMMEQVRQGDHDGRPQRQGASTP